MRVIFMGTPAFAVPALNKISSSSRHPVIAVVTNIDKPKGRGKKLQPSPVKNTAIDLNLPVIQVENLKDSSFITQISELNPDVFAVVAFRILPEKLIAVPKHGALNLHASLLPKYRGPAPIQWALINGDTKTGVTIMQIDIGIDTGDILMQQVIAIKPEETAGELSAKLSDIGAEMIIRTLDALEDDNVNRKSQDTTLSSHAPKLTPELRKIDWSNSAVSIMNLIRGLSPDYAAYTYYGNMKLNLFRAKVFSEARGPEPPGTILAANTKDGLVVETGKGAVRIIEIQREGKKMMPVDEFLKGTCPAVGEKLRSLHA